MCRVLALIVLSASTPALAGPCVTPGLVPYAITPAGAKIVKGGGILVGAMPSHDGSGGLTDAALQPTWRFRISGKLVEPHPAPLAPGLAVYPVPAGAAAVLLEDADHARQAEVTVAGDPTPLSAPRPTRAQTVTTAYDGPRGRGATTRVDLELAEASPANAVGLITYGDDGKARVWVPVTKERTVTVSRSPARCEPRIPGSLESATGDKLRFA